MADDQPTLADIFREVTRLERALSDSAAHWQSAALEINAENQALAQALHACERRHGRAVSTAQGQAKRAIELADQVRRMRSRLMAIAVTCKNDDDAPKVLSLIWNLAQDALDDTLAPSEAPCCSAC